MQLLFFSRMVQLLLRYYRLCKTFILLDILCMISIDLDSANSSKMEKGAIILYIFSQQPYHPAAQDWLPTDWS